MRLGEKTIELSFCAQFAGAHRLPMWWFGLTQKQEACAGFDAWTRLNGQLLVLQFKASNRILRSGSWRFELHHDQLDNLRQSVRAQRYVYYVFPLYGTTAELHKNPNLLGQTALLDVANLSTIKAPIKNDGNPRKSCLHHVDVRPWAATLHSDPVEVELRQAAILVGEDTLDVGFASPVQSFPGGFEQFWQLSQSLSPRSSAVLIPE